MTTARRHLDAILEMRVDSFHQALDDLDPISRALIELSVKQGLDDGEIAAMMSSDEAFVRGQRENVLRTLAGRIAPDAVDADLPELEAVVANALDEPEPDPEPDVPDDDDDD